jgi:hypothetical protein
VTANTFSVGAPSAGVPCNDVDEIIKIPLGTSACQTLSPEELATALAGTGLKYQRRCPGSNERGLSDDQLTQGGTIDCDPSQRPVGP